MKIEETYYALSLGTHIQCHTLAPLRVKECNQQTQPRVSQYNI